MLFHSEKFSGGGGGGWYCNYRVKLQVSQRFEIDLGPGPELDNKEILFILQ